MRAAIYARQSLDRHGEALAVSRQLEECRELARRNGWEAAREYVDNDVSATTRKPRPAWTQLLADLDAGHHDVLVAWHPDRLYRRVRDLVDLVEIAERNALRIASVKAGDIDLTSPAGRMLAGLLGHVSRYEMEQKGARQSAANQQRARMGDVRWTRRPFGYDRDGDGHVVLVEQEAAALRVAAARALDGDTLASIARDLTAAGTMTSTGKPFSTTTLRRVLLNPRNAGRAVYRGEDVGEAASPAILDPETLERLTATLEDPRRRTAPSTAVKYLLSGLAVCGRCGGRLYASPMGAKGSYYMVYKCRTAHRARRLDLVDQDVDAVVVARLQRPDALQLLSPSDDVAALATESQDLRSRLEGLAELYADGTLTAAAVRDSSKRLQARLDDLQARLAASEGGDVMAQLATAQDVATHWPTVALHHRRAVVERLMTVTVLPGGKGVRFTPEQVQIDWRTA